MRSVLFVSLAWLLSFCWVAVTPVAAAVARSSFQGVPFYLKEKKDGSLVAVIVYGDGLESQIEVACDPIDAPSTIDGPGVIHCFTDDDSMNLIVPFHFEKDEDGKINRVVYNNHEGETVIPFNPKYDEQGNLIGMELEEVSEHSSLSSSPCSSFSAMGLVVAAGSVVGIVFLVWILSRCNKKRAVNTSPKVAIERDVNEKESNRSEKDDEDATTVASVELTSDRV
jgi:hypothetical protein